MSLILDALKKLEQERVARRKRTVHIASDILKGREPGKRRRIWFLVAGLIGTALTAVVLTIAITTPFLPLTIVHEQAKTKETPRAAPADSRVAPRSEQTPVTAAPAKQPIVAEQPVKEKKVSTVRVNHKPSSVRPVKMSEKLARREGPEKIPAEDKQAVSFDVSAIVWVEKRSDRRAMVNDAMVREGDNIDGARVVDIHPDHIRFSYKGKDLSVYLR